jgi:F-type H+-transporting ATPase subunit b
MNINLTLLAQAVSFAILIWFTIKFVWPPLLGAIETRQQTIADGLAAAERGKLDLELATKRSAESLREGKEKVAGLLTQAEKQGSQIIEDAKALAKQEADRIVAGAKAEIEQESLRARESLRDQVAILAVAGAEKILQREIKAADHAELLAKIKQDL